MDFFAAFFAPLVLLIAGPTGGGSDEHDGDRAEQTFSPAPAGASGQAGLGQAASSAAPAAEGLLSPILPQSAQLREDAAGAPPAGTNRQKLPTWLGFGSGIRGDRYNQVRIERRVIVRIEPQPGAVSQNLAATLENTAGQPRFSEEAMGKCVAAGDILGVRATEGSRLLFFLRENGLIVASLDKTCSSRDFYSGFYFEQNSDGQLCIDRERLQSRSGAKCQLVQLHRLVPLN